MYAAVLEININRCGLTTPTALYEVKGKSQQELRTKKTGHQMRMTRMGAVVQAIRHTAVQVFSYHFLLLFALNIQSATVKSAEISGSDLHFLQDSNGYALVTNGIPDMMSFSVCFWVKLIYRYPAGSLNTMTLLSYSNSKYDTAYLVNTQGGSVNTLMDDQNY
ncbi:hypothetical protein ABFA07_011767 [Porites harrisoni]